MNADKKGFRLVFVHLCLSVFICGSVVGCTSAVQSGVNTALNGDDLVKMTDQMAASIVADPEVQAAIAREGPLKVVVEPVVNHMRGDPASGAGRGFYGTGADASGATCTGQVYVDHESRCLLSSEAARA